MSSLADACARGALANLKELNLYKNKIGDPGVSALASACASGALATLEDVYLGGNPGDSGPVNKVLREGKN